MYHELTKIPARFILGPAAIILLIAVGLWATETAPAIRPPPQQPATRPAVVRSAPQPATKPAPVAKPAQPATATSAPAPVAIGPVELPAQPAPAGLESGHVVRSVYSGSPGNWTLVGAGLESSPVSSRSNALPADLAALAPSNTGRRTTWSGWFRVSTSGNFTFYLSATGGAAAVNLIIDGQPSPTASIDRKCNPFDGCPKDPTNGLGGADLAAGWHNFQVSSTAPAGADAAVITLFARRPGAAMPAELIPSAAAGGAP